MSEENLADLLEQAADRHAVSAAPIDAVVADDRRAQVRRNGFLALAAAVVVGAVIAGTTFLFNPGGADDPGPADLAGQWKTVSYEGVLVDVPAVWEKSNAVCEWPSLGWFLPGTDPCAPRPEAGVRFYLAGTIDMANPPDKIYGNADGSRFRGYVYAGDFAVSASGPSRELVQRVLDSARVKDASTINLEGEWLLREVTDSDGEIYEVESMRGTKATFAGGIATIDAAGKCVYSAEYSQAGTRGSDLTFGSDSTFIITHDAGCPTEKDLYRVLSRTRNVTESNGVLTLQADEGSTIATLERAPVDPDIQLPAAEIATYEPTGGSNEALAHGTLTISNGCLVLGNGTDEQLIVFDATTTTLSFDGQTLQTTDERGNKVSVRVGGRLSFAGGNGPVPKDRSRVTIPTACEDAAKKEAFYTHGIGMNSARNTETPSTRDWQKELRDLLTSAGVSVLGAPEDPFNSGFLEGQIDSRKVYAVLLDDPVHGAAGRLIRSVQLGSATGDLREAANHSYIEFKCGAKDQIQLWVLESSGSIDVDRTTALARTLVVKCS